MSVASAASILATGLGLTDTGLQSQSIPDGAWCIITGDYITEGYPAAKLLSNATAEFIELTHGNPTGWVSEPAAILIKSASPRAGNPPAKATLAFEDGTCWQPMISRESATAQGRACWSDLVREVWPARRDQRCVVLLTTDTKKRLWPRCRVGSLGPRTEVLLHDTGSTISSPVVIDWETMLETLTRIEQLYTHFPKPVIGRNLFRSRDGVHAIGPRAAREYENWLSGVRTSPEFVMALLIAQKEVAP